MVTIFDLSGKSERRILRIVRRSEQSAVQIRVHRSEIGGQPA
jgi:hypothetical protein